MNKKIIAVFCVMILMMSVLVACGKTKVPTIMYKGMEYPVATDESGNTIVDESGYIAVYVTNAKGKYTEDSDGARFTTWVNFPDRLISENKLENAEYNFIAPDGWTLNSTNQSLAKNADDTMEIDLIRVSSDGTMLKEYYEEYLEQTKAQMEYFERNNYKTEFSTAECTVGAQKYPASCMICDLYSENGELKVDSRIIMMYFEYEGRIYKASYQSNNTEKYSLEKAAELFDGLTMKHYANSEKTNKSE